MSGTTLFTLGLGDVTSFSAAARWISMIEAAIGFGLIALVISYRPTLYQSFSPREVNISLLDARAGSPPRATCTLPADETRMWELRAWYEPFVVVLSRFLAMKLAPWKPSRQAHDNWSTKPGSYLDGRG